MTQVSIQCGATALMDAAYHGRTEIATLLLERGADIEAMDEVRISPPSLLLFLFSCGVS